MSIPLANGERKRRDEICMSKKVHDPRKTCEVPNTDLQNPLHKRPLAQSATYLWVYDMMTYIVTKKKLEVCKGFQYSKINVDK